MARWVTAATAAAAAAVVGSYLGVRSRRTDRLDVAARRIATAVSGPRLDTAVGATTDLGSVYGLAGVSVALAVGGHGRLAARVAGSGLVAWTLAQAAKPLVDRPRPYVDELSVRLVAEPAGTSWPSGHSAVTAAMATALWDPLPPPARAAVAAAAGGVAASRLYVGVHHATDVIAGLGIGVLSDRVVRSVLERATRRRGWSHHVERQAPADD